MPRLRSFIVLTGTIHVEGGEKHTSERASGDVGAAEVTTVRTRAISRDRRKANVVIVDYARRLRKLCFLRTGFGILIDPARLSEVKEMCNSATQDIAAFNKDAQDCRLANGYLWEPLEGNRKAAVEGWIAYHLSRHDPLVLEAVPRLFAGRVTPANAAADQA